MYIRDGISCITGRKRQFSTSLRALHHVDVDFRITLYVGFITTTIYIVYARSRLDVHRNFGRMVIGIFRFISFSSRIRSFITSAYQIMDDNGFTNICLLNVNIDVTAYTASSIIATKDIGIETTRDGQIYISRNMSIIGTAVYVLDII